MSKLVQITWQGDTGQTFNIALDVSENEKHDAASTITDHPVETGTNIADHIRPDPDTVNIEGIISNTPILLPGDHTDGAQTTQVKVEGVAPGFKVPLPVVGALIGKIPIAPAPSGTVMGFAPSFDRVAACYEELLKIRSDGRLVRLITTLREYDDMGITLISIVRNAMYGNSLKISIDFKQVRFGSTKTVPVPIIPRNKADKGNQTPTLADPPSDRASALENAFGGGGLK